MRLETGTSRRQIYNIALKSPAKRRKEKNTAFLKDYYEIHNAPTPNFILVGYVATLGQKNYALNP
jgi:hypothetical protein